MSSTLKQNPCELTDREGSTPEKVSVFDIYQGSRAL
jgi:hypothetical protein